MYFRMVIASLVMGDLEICADTEEPTPARRIRRYVGEAVRDRVAEVRHFRVVTGVRRPRFQVTSGNLDANRARGAEQVRRDGVRQLVRERELAQLDERCVFQVR